MFIVCMVAGNSISWINFSVFPLTMRNFPHNRGPVAGLLKGYMGLSAAVFSNFSENFFDSSSSKYLLMLMTISPLFCLMTAAVLRPVLPAKTPEEVSSEEKSFALFNIIACAMAVLIMMQDFVGPLQQGTAKKATLAVLFVILAAPAVVPFAISYQMKKVSSDSMASSACGNGEGFKNTTDGDFIEEVQADESINGRQHAEENKDSMGSQEVQLDTEKDDLKQPLLVKYEESSIDLEALMEKKRRFLKYWLWSSIELGEDRSTLSLFKTWHFYLLYFALLCGPGMGMAFNNNLGQVGQSFGFNTVNVFSSLFSLGNFFGRISSGIVSEYFLRSISMPRPIWMGLIKVPMVSMFIWLSTGANASLYVGSLIVGLAQGLLVTLTLPIISEFYGLKYFGVNLSVANTHIVAGSTIFSSLIAGILYDKHATSQSSDGSFVCYGSACYGTTFVIYSIFLIVAFAMDGVLSLISKPLYRKLKTINIHASKVTSQKKSENDL